MTGDRHGSRRARRCEGRLERIDDFNVTLILLDDGTRRTFRRVGDVAENRDQRSAGGAQERCCETYTDRDMHNVTAYLVTLK